MLVPLVGLGALGAGCAPVLSPSEIYQYARQAGFSQDLAVTMTAIALRESGGCPTAHNGGNPPGSEDSYGLWQINIKTNGFVLTRLGIAPAGLYDPAANAAAAFLLWAGNNANLNTAWYINRPGYREAYLSNLPIAQAAAQSVEPSYTADASAAASESTPAEDVLFTVGNLEVTTKGLAIGGGIALLAFGFAIATR